MHVNLTSKTRTFRLAGVAAITAAALLLGACGGGGSDEPSPSPSSPSASATPSETPSPTPTVEPTVLTDVAAIEVSTDMAAEPTVTAPYPFKVDQTMTKVVVEGSGPAVPSETSSATVQYAGINARTGETFDSSWSRGAPNTFQLTQLIPGFAKGVVGRTVGSRVAIVITSSEAYDPTGQPQADIQPGDTLMFIVDVLDTELTGPVGEPVTPPEGLPVVNDVAGVPSITIPAGLPEPTAVQVQPLIQGTGRALGPSDIITSHSVCTTWAGTEYHNDYGQPPVSDALSGSVHQQLFNSLVGQATGSRVLITLPGSVAYPNGNAEPSLAPNTSVACVVDVLFTQAP